MVAKSNVIKKLKNKAKAINRMKENKKGWKHESQERLNKKHEKLKQKIKIEKGNCSQQLQDYRPITCLPTMWKILTNQSSRPLKGKANIIKT